MPVLCQAGVNAFYEHLRLLRCQDASVPGDRKSAARKPDGAL